MLNFPIIFDPFVGWKIKASGGNYANDQGKVTTMGNKYNKLLFSSSISYGQIWKVVFFHEIHCR